MGYSEMNILSFIGVFKNIMFKWAFRGQWKLIAFLCWKRYCEQYIFSYVQKKIDFPKVISDFPVEVRSLDEEEQRSGKVDDKGNDEPEIRFLVDKDYLRLVHLVEQVEDGIGDDEDGLDGGGQGVETIVFNRKVINDGKDVKQNRANQQDDPEHFIGNIRQQYIREYGVFDDGVGAE